MPQKIKPSTLWTIVGAVIIFLMFNHWMSREISSPTPAQQAVNTSSSEMQESQKQTLTIPQLPDQEEIVEAPAKAITKPKPPEQDNSGPSEPIYEPPGNSVILVQ